MANSDVYYKVVMNGSYQGQAVVNLLYYRLAEEIVPTGLNFAGASDLAYQVKQEIWTPGYKPSLPVEYVLHDITVYPYDAQFDLLYQLPYTLAVNEGGALAGAATNGPATCGIIKFNLEPLSPLNGIYPPHTGYVAFGPLMDTAVQNDGRLTAGALAGLQGIANKLSQNLENIAPPAIFYPIRIKTQKVLGVWRIVSFADIQSAVVRSVASFRRSRRPE